MNIIDERDKRNRARRRMKDQYDSVMTLSAEDRWYPLLQEGMVTYSDGSPYFYIMKGALRDYYENLSESYVGSINIGHTDLATFPERIVGSWTKDNLRITDLENGRQLLETNLPVNYEHPLIKALEAAPFDVGLSVEMGMHVNDELTRSTENNPFNVPLVDSVNIYDYAIVGNAGDVNSMGIRLKGELPKMDERLKKLASLLSEEGTTSLADVSKLLDESLLEAEDKAEETKKAEEPAENLSETDEKAADETETLAEENVVPETEEASEETVEASEEVAIETNTDAFAEVLAQVTALREELDSLKEQLAQKDAEVVEAKQALAAKEADEKAFVEKFKNLSVSLTKEVKPKDVKPKSQYTDGIGE